MNKKIAAAALATALSFGTLATITTANADTGHAVGVSTKISTVLSGLVTKGTITQAQADAVLAALIAARPAHDDHDGVRPDQAAMEAHRAAEEALVASTLGIDAATIKSRLVAGETLAAIAGTKKDALIAALVAFETKEIDARVTAGTLTAAQATAMKANLTAHVTDEVNTVRGPGMGPKGGMGHGPRH